MSLEKKIEDCKSCFGKGYHIYFDKDVGNKEYYEYKKGCKKCGGSGRESTFIYNSDKRYIQGFGKLTNIYENRKLINSKPYFNPLIEIGVGIAVGTGVLYYLFN